MPFVKYACGCIGVDDTNDGRGEFILKACRGHGNKTAVYLPIRGPQCPLMSTEKTDFIHLLRRLLQAGEKMREVRRLISSE